MSRTFPNALMLICGQSWTLIIVVCCQHFRELKKLMSTQDADYDEVRVGGREEDGGGGREGQRKEGGERVRERLILISSCRKRDNREQSDQKMNRLRV